VEYQVDVAEVGVDVGVLELTVQRVDERQRLLCDAWRGAASSRANDQLGLRAMPPLGLTRASSSARTSRSTVESTVAEPNCGETALAARSGGTDVTATVRG
jgi:hypothetical protein